MRSASERVSAGTNPAFHGGADTPNGNMQEITMTGIEPGTRIKGNAERAAAMGLPTAARPRPGRVGCGGQYYPPQLL